jgi:hypothetical protein
MAATWEGSGSTPVSLISAISEYKCSRKAQMAAIGRKGDFSAGKIPSITDQNFGVDLYNVGGCGWRSYKGAIFQAKNSITTLEKQYCPFFVSCAEIRGWRKCWNE